MDPKFDLDGARKAGYSDDEIADHLGQTQEFDTAKARASGYSTQEILDHLIPSKPVDTPNTPPKSMLQQGPFKVGSDILQGAGSGVASSLIGAYDLARRAMTSKDQKVQAMPGPDPSALRRAADPSDLSTVGQMARTGEQIGEYFLPGDLIKATETGAAHVGAQVGPKTAAVAKVLGRAGGEAASAGGISAVQSGGDPEAIAQAALTAGAASGAFATIGGFLKATAPNVYKVGLEFPRHVVKSGQAGEIIDDAIANKIATPGGAQQLLENRDAITHDLINNSGHVNDPIPLSVAEDSLTEMRQLAARIGDNKMLAKVNKRWNDLMAAHGALPGQPAVASGQVTSPVLGPNGQPIVHITPGLPAIPPKSATITVGEAQQLKQDFQGIARESYGKANRQQLNKALASGQREAIENIIPEVKQANRNTQNAILLEDAISKAVAKAPGITPMDVVGLAMKPKAEVTLWLMRNPTVRAALGIIADRSGKFISAAGNTGARVAASQSFSPAALQSLPQMNVTQ